MKLKQKRIAVGDNGIWSLPLQKGNITISDIDLNQPPFCDVVWTMDRKGYACIGSTFVYRGKKYRLLHRLIYELFVTAIPDGYVMDHINRNKLDNRLSNLRMVTCKENSFNRGSNPNSASKYKGVVYHSKNKSWCAKIRFGRKVIRAGSYNTEIGAALAYNDLAKIYHGEYAVLNEVDEIKDREKRTKPKTSVFECVFFSKWHNKWIAQISREGVKKYIGKYKEENSAGVAATEAYLKVFGRPNLANIKILNERGIII